MRYADSNCTYTEEYDANGVHWYHYEGRCVVTGKIQCVSIKGPDLFRYRQGELSQNAFPYLTPGQREFLISGTSDEGWKKMFG